MYVVENPNICKGQLDKAAYKNSSHRAKKYKDTGSIQSASSSEQLNKLGVSRKQRIIWVGSILASLRIRDLTGQKPQGMN
jgi:hypothetical protein